MPSEFTKGFTKTFEGSFQTGQRIGARSAEMAMARKWAQEEEKHKLFKQIQNMKIRVKTMRGQAGSMKKNGMLDDFGYEYIIKMLDTNDPDGNPIIENVNNAEDAIETAVTRRDAKLRDFYADDALKWFDAGMPQSWPGMLNRDGSSNDPKREMYIYLAGNFWGKDAKGKTKGSGTEKERIVAETNDWIKRIQSEEKSVDDWQLEGPESYDWFMENEPGKKITERYLTEYPEPKDEYFPGANKILSEGLNQYDKMEMINNDWTKKYPNKVAYAQNRMWDYGVATGVIDPKSAKVFPFQDRASDTGFQRPTENQYATSHIRRQLNQTQLPSATDPNPLPATIQQPPTVPSVPKQNTTIQQSIQTPAQVTPESDADWEEFKLQVQRRGGLSPSEKQKARNRFPLHAGEIDSLF